MAYFIRKIDGRGLLRDSATGELKRIHCDKWAEFEGLPKGHWVGYCYDVEIQEGDADLLKALNKAYERQRLERQGRTDATAAKLAAQKAKGKKPEPAKPKPVIEKEAGTMERIYEQSPEPAPKPAKKAKKTRARKTKK